MASAFFLTGTVLGLKDEDAILGILIKKIVTNLQHRYTLEPVLKSNNFVAREIIRMRANISDVRNPGILL